MLVASSAASASNVSWDCKVNYTKNGGLISTWYAFNYDADIPEASVIDGVIQYYKKQFVPVGKIKDDGTKVVFNWMIRIKTTSQSATLTYNAAIDRKTGKLNVQAVPLGYDNSENVRGSCKEVPGPLVLK